MAAAAHFGLFWPESAVSACFGGHFGRNWQYQHVLVSVSALSVPISAGIGPFWPESARFGPNHRESKKKKRGESARWTPNAASGRIGLRYDNLGAASVLSRTIGRPQTL